MKRWFTGVGKYVLIGIWIAQTGLVLLMCALLDRACRDMLKDETQEPLP